MLPGKTAKKMDRKRRVLALRSQGMDFSEIAKQIRKEFDQPNYNWVGVDRDFREAIAELNRENQASLHELRLLETIKYDSYLEKLQRKIERGDTNAIQTALKISAERNKLLGLYVPVELKINQIVSDRLNAELDNFINLIENDEELPESAKERIRQIIADIE